MLDITLPERQPVSEEQRTENNWIVTALEKYDSW